VNFFEISEYLNTTALVGIFRFDEPYILLAVLMGYSFTAAVALGDLLESVGERLQRVLIFIGERY
jgi:hypothetical protein